jgi:hypothetical protein
LENSGFFTSPTDYPPLTPAEIEEFADRARVGPRFSRAELERLQQHSPMMAGEIIMSAHRGDVWVKRYVGMDVSEF